MKKLLIIAGAGASIDFGMPSVRGIDKLFEKWSNEIISLKDEPDKSLYHYVKEELRKYIVLNPHNYIDNIINFENLLFTIQNIGDLLTDKDWSHYNSRLNAFVDFKNIPEIIRFAKQEIANGTDFHFLHSYLIDKLLDHFREKGALLLSDKKNEIKKLSNFFGELKSEYELGFINLNYDNVILSALPDLETGFSKSTGAFEREVLYNGNWNFCYHLHGSIHFDMKNNGFPPHMIYWNPDLSSNFAQNSSGRNLNNTIEGTNHLNTCIIAGLDKSNQLLREPFGSYFMQLDRLIFEADAILFIGYGFSDYHLNSAFPFIRYDKKIRKIVIIDWASDNEDGLQFRHDSWSQGLFSTIPYNGHEMGDGVHLSAIPVSEFRANHQLEVSSNPNLPMGVWYNGLMEACEHTDVILKHLK